jgi:hypothetical protein
LDEYLSEDASPAANDSQADIDDPIQVSAPAENEGNVPGSGLQSGFDPREHWLDLVRKTAPELLIPPEQESTQWQWAEQAAGPKPQVGVAAEMSHRVTERRLEQDLERDQEQSGTNLPIHNLEAATASAPRPTAESAPRQDEKSLEASDNTANLEMTAQQQPGWKSASAEGWGTSLKADRITTTADSIGEAKPSRRFAGDELTAELTKDARSFRSAPTPAGERKPNLANPHCDPPPSSQPVMASAKSQPLPGVARLRNLFFRGSAGNESGKRRPQTNLNSTLASSTTRQEQGRPKEQVSPSPPAVSHVHQQTSVQAENREVRSRSERNIAEAVTPVQPLRETAEPRLSVNEHDGAKAAPAQNLNRHFSSPANSDLWPDLPEWLPEETANMQFLRRLEHLQALDAEQQGAN